MKQPFLLDTCAIICIVDDRISRTANEALAAAWKDGVHSYVSPITAWEVGILASRGRFKSPDPPMRWFEKVMARPFMVLAELPPRVLLESSFMPGKLPRDPADRIIAATAREYGYTVMTRDRALLDYAQQGYLSAIEC
jgi:PIN domain nuclease of toxin-antitoxin system